MYPRSDAALVPFVLRSRLAHVPIDAATCRAANLPDGSMLTALDASTTRLLDPALRNHLGQRVAASVQSLTGELLADDSPVISRPMDADGLDLSKRVVNCLTRGGFLKEGVLQPCQISDLVRLPNFGARSILELLVTTEGRTQSDETVLQASAARSPRVRERQRAVSSLLAAQPWTSGVRRGDPRLGVELAALAPGASDANDAAVWLAELPETPGTEAACAAVEPFIARVERLGGLDLRAELIDLVRSEVKEPQVPAVIARLGLDGTPPVTLQEAADLLGVTRERIRQVCAKLTKRVEAAGGVYAPRLDEALRICREAAPAEVGELEQHLQAQGIVDRPFSIESLNAAANVFGRDQLPLDASVGLVSDGDSFPTVAAIGATARRLVTHWGVTTVDEVLTQLQLPITGGNTATLRVVLERHCKARWLESDQRWFWIDGSRNRLLNHVAKIMSVAGSIEITELRDGVGRFHRMKGFRPPRAVLAALCADCGLYEIHGDRVSGGTALPDWSTVLGKNEAMLAETLFEHGPVMRRSDLEELVVQGLGMPRSSFYIYLTYSPILRRFAPGVFGLRGAPVTAAEVKALIPRRARTQVLRDFGWSSDGSFWCAYRLSEAAVTSGVLSLPSAVRDAIQGRFTLHTEDDAPAGTLVVEDQMWGLGPLYRRRGVETGDFIVLVLNLATKSARCLVGTEELLLRFQDGE